MLNRSARRPSTREGGNAVTLTLLGLAVAILAGVIVLYFIGAHTPQPVPVPPVGETTAPSVDETVDPRAGWRSYDSDEYNFHIEFPDGWAVATGTLFGDPAISIYLAGAATGTPPYSHLNIGVPHVSIYPQGLSTERLFADTFQSSVALTVPQASEVEYRVTNGSPWGTMGTFERHPDSWSDAGFVFSSASIEELEFGCMRGNVGIDIDECRPYEGDRSVVHGFVDKAVRNTEEEILRSFAFTEPTDTSPSVSATDDLITVVSPTTGMFVTSPLSVRGQARGTWYFEASFPVRLETETGEVLAEVPATALDDWMTEEYVPFEVSIVFASTTATTGRLVLERDNPSGDPAHDMSITIPVRFSESQQQSS